MTVVLGVEVVLVIISVDVAEQSSGNTIRTLRANGYRCTCTFYTSLPPFKDHANIYYIREEEEVRRRTKKR